MTEVEKARELLSGPLVFGNKQQIAAVSLVSAVEACAEAIKNCPHGNHGICDECDGDGECFKCCHECDECSGSGRAVGCNCTAAWTVEINNAARKLWRSRRYD